MGNIIKVGMADLNVCKAPDGLTTLGLGSCIGLTLYDPVTKIGGMVHYMLPDSTKVSNNSNKAKFADTGIEELLKNIGARNAEAAKKILKEKGIRLVAEDTGLNYGRTVELHCDTGEFLIKSVGKPIKTI